MNNQELIKKIAAALASINPYKAILYGSSAYGEPGPDSDIDLIVVLNRHGYPANYAEKMENHRSIRKLLREINREVALDIVVYTIDEWDLFLKTGSSFSRVVIEKGRAIA